MIKINIYVLTEFTGCCGEEVIFIGDIYNLQDYLNKCDIDYVINKDNIEVLNLDYDLIQKEININVSRETIGGCYNEKD